MDYFDIQYFMEFASKREKRRIIMKVVEKWELHEIKLLLEAAASITDVNVKDVALSVATTTGNIDGMRYLKRAGANVNHSDHKGKPLLVRAVEKRPREVVEALLEMGADVNIKAQHPQHPLIRLGTPLTTAICRRDTQLLQTLINKGADVNQTNNTGAESPLLLAVEAIMHTGVDNVKAKDIANILLQAGADVNYADEHGTTALMEASFSGHLDCIKMLLEAGADVNARDVEDSTALMKAACNVQNIVDCAKVLLEAGAKVNFCDKWGITALNNTGLGGTVEMFALLLNHGSIINHCTGNDENALTTYLNEFGPCGFEVDKDAVMLLHAAGEYISRDDAEDPEYLEFDELNLAHLCREAIRDHMIDVVPKVSLFHRVKQLEIPEALKSFLLFDQSLEKYGPVKEGLEIVDHCEDIERHI